ncbi:hypothetical protein, partial [Pseudoduganella sp. GCM10020061]|uniref:hypothetical protein n=1 Tax=Pseudoduganella sp. GCM10020061 TaxID=3317345 RepID=UPI003630509C
RTWNEKTGKATYLTHRLAALSTIGVTLPDRKNSRSICRIAGGINIRGTRGEWCLTPIKNENYLHLVAGFARIVCISTILGRHHHAEL